MSRPFATVHAALLSSFLIVPALSAQSEAEEQVTALLEVGGAALIEDGFTLTDIKTDGDFLDEGGTFDFWVELEGGVEYVLIGVCEDDCSDVDLEIFDAEGGSVMADYAPDDYPLVGLTSRGPARFRVHVSMAACSVEPCAWGVGVFKGSTTDQAPRAPRR